MRQARQAAIARSAGGARERRHQERAERDAADAASRATDEGATREVFEVVVGGLHGGSEMEGRSEGETERGDA